MLFVTWLFLLTSLSMLKACMLNRLHDIGIIFLEIVKVVETMQKTINVRKLTIYFGILFVMLVRGIFVQSVKANDDEAKEREIYWQGYVDTYKLDADSGYNYTESDRVDQMPYGRKYAGFFFVHGVDVVEKRHGSYVAYGTQGTITFGYDYDNSLKENKKGQWNIEDDGQDTVKGIKLNKDVDSGAVIVERSYDTVNWKVVETRRDFFDSHPDGEPDIYTTKPEDVKHGAYYRVTVAYRVEYERGFGKTNKRAECVEVYYFYVGEYQSSLHVREVYSGGEITLSGSATVTHGFSVMSDSADAKIFVKGPDDSSDFLVPQNSVFTKAGDYSIRFRTALEDEYKYTLSIREGTEAIELKPLAYSGDGSYKNLQLMDSPVGDRNMTSLFVEQTKGYTIKKSELNGVPAISVSGEGVKLFLQLNYEKEIGYGQQLSSDSYGGKEGQTLFDVVVGKIESGALIIQTSKDGNNWENIDKGRYETGLYTTDFQNQFGSGRRIEIYTPNGQEVLDGLYVRVLYAYEVERKDETRNIVEEYKFYLSNSNVHAVTFHNLSAKEKLQEVLSDEDQSTIDLYKRAETLEDYTLTLTGFEIDTSLNPTVKYEVKKDGDVQVGSTRVFTETGKYEITLKSVTESTKLTIFVDKDTSAESLKLYFGDGFLQGKRVFAEGEYPVYVAGKTSYNIEKIPLTRLPVSGEIHNLTTGKIIKIEAGRDAKSKTIDEPGIYEARLYTNKTYLTDSPVGDTRVFTFRFEIIPESKTPGPVVNERNLGEYAKTNVSDLCPRYYAVSYPSAGKGEIRCAFATWEDAYAFAAKQEEGLVEQQSDGTYCYRGELLVTKNEIYEDSWAVEDAIDYFVRQAICEYYFDMSNDDSYVTLSEEVLASESNLRKLELAHTVVIFGEGQKEKLVAKNALPIVSPKKQAFIKPGLDQSVERKIDDFRFVKDEHEYDSQYAVVNCNEKAYRINYTEGIGSQLEKAGCDSGVIHISEWNKYGDPNDYDAVFIREGENLASVTILSLSSVGDEKTEITVDRNSETRKYQVEAFSPLSIIDPTDPYSYIRISCNGKKDYYLNDTLDESGEKRIYVQSGDYTVRCINRLGYSFEFVVTIQDGSKFTTIQCVDDKDTVQGVVCTSQGSKEVSLPIFERYGYELVGYIDSQNKEYPLVLSEVEFVGNVTLKAKWKPKDCIIKIVNQDSVTITRLVVKYHETVDVNALCTEAGISVTSLSKSDGQALDNGMITIDSVDETIILATVSPMDETTKETNPWSKKKKTIVGVLATIIMMLIVIVIVAFMKKHPDDEREGENNLQENKFIESAEEKSMEEKSNEEV